ncbi:MAG: Fic family protein [Bacteroidales bacterium]|nr:Fic family protein [Bacteroidales bacterium]
MLPEAGSVVRYAAIIDVLELPVPVPETIAVIRENDKKYEKPGWKVFTPKHQPDETLYKQLVFALKYEGINLLFFKKLFEELSKKEIIELLQIEPTGQYSRKIWFIYEWLMNERLEIPDLTIKKAVPLLDEKLQYAIKGKSSPRHRIINNLPGTPGYCPLIRRTPKIDNYITSDFAQQKSAYLKGIRKDILQRASAFLLLKDSKASFTIEGESPKSKRTARWGHAIGQAGVKPLSKEELLRLQQIVIENSRFTKMGFRQQGGFVGDHDRNTGEPIPDHIAAKWQDVVQLIEGLITTTELLLREENFDAVLAAAMVAFGFVFIHPYVDGNGRIHRYIIHHILASRKFSQQGIIFPVSASILDRIDEYRKVLESYSYPLLDLIEWKATSDNNVAVLNETIDYYRYFDATVQAEFLYDCVYDTINTIIPHEVKHIERYDEFKRYIDDEFEMPDKMVATLVRFLEQNDGILSRKAKTKEFAELNGNEIKQIENKYREIFLED